MDADATGPKVSPADIAGHLKPANVTWIFHSSAQVSLFDRRGVTCDTGVCRVS